jgi:hypothetical protein
MREEDFFSEGSSNERHIELSETQRGRREWEEKCVREKKSGPTTQKGFVRQAGKKRQAAGKKCVRDSSGYPAAALACARREE